MDEPGVSFKRQGCRDQEGARDKPRYKTMTLAREFLQVVPVQAAVLINDEGRRSCPPLRRRPSSAGTAATR